MTVGTCRFCEEQKELKRSHAIGNTVFSRILKKCEGNAAIRIAVRENKIKLCNDSWATVQLCEDCERFFNSKFENYSIYTLRGKQKGVEVTKTDKGMIFRNINQYRIILYLLSIYWRAGWSKHKAYDHVYIRGAISKQLKNCFKGEETLNSSLYCVKISKVIDKSQGFTEEALGQIIINPFNRVLKKGYCLCMLYEGYFFEIFFNAVNFKERNKPGYLNKLKKILVVPYIDIFDIPEVVEIFRKGIYIENSRLKS